MKKLTIAIALLLCLVMCVFCFASCKKKNKNKTEATTEATTTAHVHTPAADYTVDLQPTCVKAGSKSKHCTGCGEIIPETVTTIPATGEHTVAEWTEIPSTLIRAGSKSGTCTVCRQTITENFDKTEPIIYLSNWDLETRNANAYTIANPDDSTIKTFGIKKNVKGIIGDSGIFYPTEENDKGNDLLIEFSFLYNDTMANAGDGVLTAMYVENNNVFNVNLKTGKITAKERTGDAYIMPTPEEIAADETKKEVAIGAYGWHRFGVRIHEDAKIEADAVVYTVTATAYLDGAKIMEVDKTAWATQNFTGDYTGLLYTATIEEGKLTYKNAVDDGKHCDAYVMVEELPKESENPGYLVVGDIAMTCGQEFDQKVFALKDPAAATLEVAEGVTLPAAFYYVSEHDHVWDGDPSVVVAATLLSDGLRKKTCSICGEQGELVAYACEPTQWTYTTETATANKMETKIEDILGEDKHFYPDESNGGKGLDLYIEYSILWNETLVKLNAGSDDMVVYGSLWGQDAYWLSLTNNAKGSSCPYAGGFEFISLRTVESGPHGMSELTINKDKPKGEPKTGDQFTDFPNIGGADQAHPEYGWHRVAIVFHEDVLKDTGIVNGGSGDAINNASYKMTSTCYVDGVKIYTLTNATDDEFLASTMKNGTLLFKTNEENAPFTYTDVAGDKIVTGLEIPVKKTSEGNAYVLIADYSVTAGKDFVQKVEKAPNAAEKTITVAEGVTLPAKVWYKEAMDVDVLTLNSADKQDYALFAGLEDEVLAGGRHFYPTEGNEDGNDLYIECAILWNETVVNNCVGNLTTGTCKPNKYESPVRTSWMALNAGGGNGCDCQHAGGFEYCDLVKHDEETPAGKSMAGDTSPFDAFPNIAGADQANPEYGWHYLTMKIHQEVTNADALKADTVAGATKALYKFTNTVYVDGVKLFELSYSGDGVSGDPSGKAYWGTNMAHALFQATSDGQGGIKYEDTARGVFVDVNAKAKDVNNPGYFVYADLNFTCGKAPVHNVVKVADPAAATFTYNEVDIPAAMYFAY